MPEEPPQLNVTYLKTRRQPLLQWLKSRSKRKEDRELDDTTQHVLNHAMDKGYVAFSMNLPWGHFSIYLPREDFSMGTLFMETVLKVLKSAMVPPSAHDEDNEQGVPTAPPKKGDVGYA